MNFQKIPSVRKIDAFLDTAFSRARKESDKSRMSFKDSKALSRIIKSRIAELKKIESAGEYLSSAFMDIVENFPSYNSLPMFYQEVFKCLFDVDEMRKSLAAVNWAAKTITKLQFDTVAKIKRCRILENMNKIRQGFYGRTCSIIEQVKKDLDGLETIRLKLREVPTVDLDNFTIAIAGFPNVGKSTLLSKLSSSKPKIADYPFTTKGINIGYFEFRNYKIQLLDTPGTLNRFQKMNDIEKLAYLTMKHAADMIIFIFDLTEEYSIEDQHELFKKVSAYEKDIVVYLSKRDVLDEETLDDFINKNKDLIICDIAMLEKIIIEKLRASQKK